MDLDRQTIEKRDFPFVRRGYDTAAVDAHLASLAGQVEALKRAAAQKPRGTESLASAAATQVQAIVEAAETTAADIKRQADLEARRVSQDAERDAEHTRDEAVARAQTHVEEVSKATSLMLQRVGAMETEVSALIESLRTGANRLTADLALLEGNMGDLYDAAGRKRSAPPPPGSSRIAADARTHAKYSIAFGALASGIRCQLRGPVSFPRCPSMSRRPSTPSPSPAPNGWRASTLRSPQAKSSRSARPSFHEPPGPPAFAA